MPQCIILEQSETIIVHACTEQTKKRGFLYFSVDFKIKGHPLKRKKALKNLKFVCEYCSTHFDAPAFHLSPSEIVELGPTGRLKGNILAMLANLFFCFEMTQRVSSLRIKSSGILLSSSSSSLSNQNLSERTLVDPDNLHQHSFHSSSTKSLASSQSGKKGAELGSQDPTPTNSTSNLRAFNAPFRSMLNKTQSKALAAFGREKSHLKGTHTHSSPLIQAQLAPPVSSDKLISASTESLNIRTQVKNTRVKNRSSFLSRITNPLRTSQGRGAQLNSSTPHLSIFMDGISTRADDESTDGDTKDDAASPAVRESFTLDKQHTYASASAAGLPIISDQQKKAPVPSDEPDTSVTGSAAGPNFARLKTKGGPIALSNLLQLHHGDSTYTIAAQKQPIPSNVKELRVNLRSFITSLQSESIHMEREAMIQRLQLYHPVKESLRKDPLRSGSTIVPGVASSPVVTIPSDIDLKTSASSPSLQQQDSKSSVPMNPSLEQFERDEILIRLQTSKEDNIEIRHETHPVATRSIPKSHKPKRLSSSPMSNGEVFNELVQQSMQSASAPPLSPGRTGKAAKHVKAEAVDVPPLSPGQTGKAARHVKAEAVDVPPLSPGRSRKAAAGHTKAAETVAPPLNPCRSSKAAGHGKAEAAVPPVSGRAICSKVSSPVSPRRSSKNAARSGVEDTEMEASLNPWGKPFHQNSRVSSHNSS